MSEANVKALKHSEYTDFSKGIIPLDLAPVVEVPEGQELIQATITGAAELSCDAKSINITTQLLAFNALVLYRNHPMTSGELRDVGFNLHRTTFQRHLDILSVKLLELTGEQVIEKEGYGKGMTYRLSPRFQLEDIRDEIDAALPLKLQRLATYYPDTFAEFDDKQPVNFRSNAARRTAFAMIIRDYSKLPVVKRALYKTFGARADTVRTRSFANTQPSQEVCLEHFSKIERGLASATAGDNSLEALQAATDMVVAYQHLFYDHLFMVDILARDFADIPQDYPDLFEEGSIQLIKAIMSYTPTRKEEPEGTFGSAAYGWIRNGILHHCLYERSLLDIPQYYIARRRAVVKTLDGYIAKHGRTPSNKEVADELALTADQVQDALALPFSTQEAAALEFMLTDDPDHFEKDLHAYLAHLEIHELFRETSHAAALTEREKIVLSLRYGIFAPVLAGAEFRTRGVLKWVYPPAVEGMPKFEPLFDRIADILGVSKMTIHGLEKAALKKSRRILLDKGVKGVDII